MTLHFSRRGLLHSAIAGGMASPLLPFLPHAARSQAAAPKRLLVVFHPMGYLESGFFPKITTETDFALGETMAPLAAFQNKLILLDGLENRGGTWTYGFVNGKQLDNEHGLGMASAFTGSGKKLSGGEYADSISIDQAVADFVYKQTPTRFRNLALGVNAGSPGGHTSCFFTGPSTPVNNQNSPIAAFDNVFRDLATGGGTSDNSAALARIKKQRQSVIDLVRSDVSSICNRLGTTEKQKCDAHLAGIRQMEAALNSVKPTVSTGCSKPAAPSAADLVATAHSQMDVVTAAFTCDLTRVATIQMGGADGGSDPPGFNHHNVAHATGDTNLAANVVADHKKIDLWFNERFAYLLRKLDSVQEANGTLLDNTLILFGSDTTQGTSTGMVGAHQSARFPFFLAGGANFAWKTGRALPLIPAGTKKWIPHNRLLVSIAQKFGLQVNTFGTHDPGTGTLTML